MENNINDTMYTKKQAAAKLNVSVMSINNYIKQKKLKIIKLGTSKCNKVLISETALNDFINGRY